MGSGTTQSVHDPLSKWNGYFVTVPNKNVRLHAQRGRNLFSKHLPELKYDELGKWLHDAGFDG